METLAERIAQDGPLGPEEAVGWVIRLAKHLESLHVHGVAHGSVSPACVATDGNAPTARGVVLDVRKIAPDVSFHSPERVRSGQISPQDDAWALAATLYTVVTGTAPFQGGSEPETRDRILGAQPPPLAVYGVDDENLQRIVAGGIARDPAHRYTSLAQLRSDLERWLPGGAALEALEDEADGDEDQAATTMLPMQDALRAMNAARAPAPAPAPRPGPPPAPATMMSSAMGAPPPPVAAPFQPPPSAPRPGPPPSAPRPAPPTPAAGAPPRPAPPLAPLPPPPAEEPLADALFEEPSYEDGPKQEGDDTVMRELPAHIMALAARSAAGSTPPPPAPEAPLPPVQVPRAPTAPSMVGGPVGLPAGPPSRPEPARPAAAARPRVPTPIGVPPGPVDDDIDDVRTVFAVHAMTELAEQERRPPPAAPPPPAQPSPAAPPGAPALPSAPVDDDDEDEGARTVIREPAPLSPNRPGPPAPPPPSGMAPGGMPASAARAFKSTQLGVGGGGGFPPPAPTGPGGWSPAAAPGALASASPGMAGPHGGVDNVGGPSMGTIPMSPSPIPSLGGPHGGPHAGGPNVGGAAPAFEDSPAAQPTPQSGIRLGAQGGPAQVGPAQGSGADVSALIQDALGPQVSHAHGPGARPDSSTGGFPVPADPHGFAGQGYGMQGMAPHGMGPQGFAPPGMQQGFGQDAGPPHGQPHGGMPQGPQGHGGQPGYDPGQGFGTPSQGGFPGAPHGPFDPSASGNQGDGAFPLAPQGGGAQIPAHLLTAHGQVAPERGSMRTWYVVCLLAMVLVAAVTFIALRYMSAG